MSLLAGLLGALFGSGVTDSEIRAEAWALGGRHQGEVLRGARAELAGDGLSAHRATLLRAVIRSHQPAATR